MGLISVSPVSERFNLTPRERDALEYLLQGLSNKEIANRMNVSPNTVKAFLRLIMLKMEVSSRAANVHSAAEAGAPCGETHEEGL